ncbi:MAG TPA: dihydrofolate reductase family protein [Solirubrobacterales bacterium]|nr:dihydrofolate reductase family protein [Solirubrobacterales bacterium]
MRKLIVTEFVTLDGVMEAPGGEETHPHTGWVFDYIGEEQMEFKLQETLEAEVQLVGRVTYESFAGAWPERQGEFADKMNSMPKYVVTTTLDELEWENSTPVRGDIAAEVAKLKSEEGGPILVAGSRTLVHFLLDSDLVDELRLMVFPVVLGSGKRLFPDSPDKTPLELVDTTTFATGVQVSTYRPTGSEAE